MKNIFELAKEAGAQIISKTVLREAKAQEKYEEAYNILSVCIPGFEKYYEMNAFDVDAWTDIYELDGITYAVYGEGALTQNDDVIVFETK